MSILEKKEVIYAIIGKFIIYVTIPNIQTISR
jgi:hypothetical protein